MIDTNRGTGRTWNQLKNLPDGSIYMVNNSAMISHVRQMLVAQGRRSDAVRIYVLNDMSVETLRGVHHDTAVVTDHHLDDVGHHHGQTWTWFLQLMVARRR